MIKHGAKPNRTDHRDYDFHKTFGAIVPAKFPDEFLTDAGLGFPDQNAEGLPYGCTDETQTELANDIAAEELYSPFELETVTHANARGGYGIRDSLEAARKLGWIVAYFNIRPHQLDFFDTIRLAMMSGIPEKRSVSIGTPWFRAWQGKNDVMPTPHLEDYGGWHNWKIAGWKNINGKPYLIAKTWQGANVDYVYFSREIINSVMTVLGTVAFTASNMKPNNVQRIDLNFFWKMWSYLRTLAPFSY